jgi:SsrA-binding protein
MPAPDGPRIRPIAQNRRARHEYELLDELECGVELKGTEVKSLRAGQGSIAEAYAHFRKGELYLVGAHIPEYAHGNVHNHDPRRERKLLAHRRELAGWDRKVREKGVTVVPLALYFKGSKVKVSLALARGKKLYDKRESKREADDRRAMERAMMRRR